MKVLNKPKVKKFDSRKYKNIINKLTETTPGMEIEKSCKEIAIDILQNYESFERIEEGPKFRGTPFDFLGFKDKNPYIIELKCSLKSFNTPIETQKRRMKEILYRINNLSVALLQIKLRKSEYRIFYHKDMESILKIRGAPIKPIIKWLKARI
jgi:hypothetical protein